MLGSTFIRIYFHAYVYLFEYFNSRNINITPASMCSCPCCRIIVMIPKFYFYINIKCIGLLSIRIIIIYNNINIYIII